MELYRKKFQYDAEFPFDYSYRDTRSAQNELPDHIHDWYEIVYIYSGGGTFFIDQGIYEARAGDALLIPGNTIHRSFPVDSDPKTSTALFFSPSLVHHQPLGDSFSYLRLFELARRHQSYRLTLDAQQRGRIEELIELVHLEMSERTAGYRQAALLHLQHILLQLGRCLDRAQPIVEAADSRTAVPGWMNGILRYIEDNLDGRLGLAQLAERASVTPSHFSRVFKGLTGMNVTDYVTTKRIIQAKELLLEDDRNDDNIAAIAASCGFDSLPHFHRRFKGLTGTTPAKYRRGM
ncbi:AraC family transcriptional regulator [Paenibacillus sp. J5C_2022]|uniref:AraC family transcriptional regulator n=1 Tax=Paenibacillus sp. J5C2022 TaxID=2977129 RepID=UPI0021D0E5EA|nr:AraC family transcriptional regulator [Paenibacillus sp. J5C2022]MCU6712536.1 AraC family transcriptional regulator [Paenibacillus sp. J5C2022]